MKKKVQVGNRILVGKSWHWEIWKYIDRDEYLIEQDNWGVTVGRGSLVSLKKVVEEALKMEVMIDRSGNGHHMIGTAKIVRKE